MTDYHLPDKQMIDRYIERDQPEPRITGDDWFDLFNKLAEVAAAWPDLSYVEYPYIDFYRHIHYVNSNDPDNSDIYGWTVSVDFAYDDNGNTLAVWGYVRENTPIHGWTDNLPPEPFDKVCCDNLMLFYSELKDVLVCDLEIEDVVFKVNNVNVEVK